MIYKHLILFFVLLSFAFQAESQTCTPPSTVQRICGSCHGGGGSGKNTSDFENQQIKNNGIERVNTIEGIPKSLKKELEQCWEGIKKLDQEVSSNPEDSALKEKRNGCFRSYETILSSFSKNYEALSENKDPDQNIIPGLEKENDPQNLKVCSDEESKKEQSLIDVEKTTKKLEKPTQDELAGSARTAPPTGSFGDVPGLKGGTGGEKGKVQDDKRHASLENSEGDDPFKKAKEEKEKGKISTAFLRIFTNQAVAEGSLEDSKTGFFGRLKDSIGSFFKGDGKSREKGASSFDQGEYIAQQRVQTILARSGDKALKKNYEQFTAEKNHQTRKTNDIAGEGEAAVQKRHEKNVDEQKKTNDELDKAIKAIAKICQNQQAEIKCWKTGNTPPPLPFPFGGGPPPEEETPEEEIEDWSELIKRSASYYCPNPDQPFVLTGEAGLWRSGLILTPKGIVLTHLDPLFDFEFHPKGCLVRMPDPLDPEKFEVYVSEPRFIQDVSTRDQLIYLVPEAPHVENSVFLGTPEDERKFPTILDYIKNSPDSCTVSNLRMGTPLKIIAYNEPAKYEKERPIGIFDGLSTAFPNGEEKTMTAIVEAQDGTTGGAVAHRDTKCFQGIGRIKKVDEKTTIRDIIPLETINKFIEESIEVLNRDESAE